MLEFCVNRQVIKRSDSNYVVANSSDYLTAEFGFSNDWKDLGKTAIFTTTTGSISIILDSNNQILEDKHLNLTAGTWVVSVVGVNGTRKIITNIASMTVVDSGAESGTVPTGPTPDVYDQIITQLTAIMNMITSDNVADTIVGRDENGSTELASLKLDTTAVITPVLGEISWNAAEFTADIQSIDGVSMQINQEQTRPVTNNTASTITNGTVVYWTSTNGNSGNYNVAPYIANGTIESERILGIATHDIEAGTNGLITYWGKIRGINTTGTPVSETWTSGTILYASPTTAGKLTSVRPNYPNRATRIAIVINAHANAGTISVNRTNYPLAEQIGVKDVGNYFTATNLEGILQEIGLKLV